MASRTVVDSVELVKARPPNWQELEHELAELRQRFPGALMARYLDRVPSIPRSAYIAPTAYLIGLVKIAEEANVWPGCILRGDIAGIEVGARTNLQDGTVVHVGDVDPTFVGDEVVVGHRAVLHGCHVEGGCLIGIQSTILDGARIGHGSVVGAGAVVTAGTQIPPHSLVLGIPGKVVRTLTPEDEERHREQARKYTRLAHNYLIG